MKAHLFFVCLLSLTYLVAAENGHGGSIRRQKAEASREGGPGPYIGGDKLSTVIDQTPESTVQPTFDEDGSTMRYEIMFREGASYTTVHFSDFNLGNGCTMTVSGKDLPDGRKQQYQMTGKGKMDLGTFWTQHVKGDTMYIDVQCADNLIDNDHFTVDEVAVGFNEGQQGDDGRIDESQCGTSDFENAICYSGNTAYTKAKAVARLLIDGNSFCTGWLVSSSNYLITCDHCISSQSSASNTDYEFLAEAPSCSSTNCKQCHAGTSFSGSTFIGSSSSLDYSIVKITSGDPASTYGYLELDNRVPSVGEQIYIPQHPAGRAKEFGIISTHDKDSGVCQINSISEPPCTGSGNDLGYYCDTLGGSSGSPILSASTNKVIGLHHCGGSSACSQSGGDPNLAVPMTSIYNYISCALDDSCTTSGCSFATTFTDGLWKLAGGLRTLFP